MSNKIKMCKCCIMHSRIPGITINKEGICSDCTDFMDEEKNNTEEMVQKYEKKDV